MKKSEIYNMIQNDVNILRKGGDHLSNFIVLDSRKISRNELNAIIGIVKLTLGDFTIKHRITYIENSKLLKLDYVISRYI